MGKLTNKLMTISAATLLFASPMVVTASNSVSAATIKKNSSSSTKSSSAKITTNKSTKSTSSVSSESKIYSPDLSQGTTNIVQNTIAANPTAAGVSPTALGTANIGKGASSLANAIQITGLFAAANTSFGSTGSGIKSATDANGKTYDYGLITGSKNAVSIFSNDKYRLDFSKDFTGKVNLNFGENVDKDGVAFVIQNDPRGTKAITTFQSGENLGVAGSAYSTNAASAASTAIQKSFAVGFDLYSNNYSSNYFDNGNETVPHMAWNFPAQSSSYTGTGSTSSGWKIAHNNGYIIDGAANVKSNTWYQFVFTYSKSAQTFQYYLSNKSGKQTPTVSVPMDQMKTVLGIDPNDANNSKAYWGFTGANGDAAGDVKFAFEQVPVNLTANITDDVTAPVTTDTGAKNVSVVDKANSSTFQYGVTPYTDPHTFVTYTETLTVSDLEAEGMTFNALYGNVSPTAFNVGGSIRNIFAYINGTKYKGNWYTYLGGTLANSSPGDFKAVFDGTNGSQVLPTLHNGDKITFTFDVEAAPETAYGTPAPTITTPTKGIFKTSIAFTNVKTNSPLTFYAPDAAVWVKGVVPTQLSWEPADPAQTDESVTAERSTVTDGYPFDFYWKDWDNADNLKFLLRKKNSDGTLSTEWANTTAKTSTTNTAWTKASMSIPFSAIDFDNNATVNNFVIEAYRVLPDGTLSKEAATLNLELTIDGVLVLQEVPTSLNWKGLSSDIIGENLSRTDPSSLKVLDSRIGDNAWSVGVSATKNDASILYNLMFKHGSTDANPTQITNQVQKALDSTDTSLSSANFLYTKTWAKDDGVLLSNPEYLSVGDYQNKITVNWQLYDTANIS